MSFIHQFTDATTASLFGIFALWAAGSRRHWFLRTAVVAAAVLILLLIPAYEALIKSTVQMIVIVGGLSLWQSWRQRRSPDHSSADSESVAPPNHRLRISLETLLLLMAVVAVVTSVIARAPHLTIDEWYECAFVGGMAGAGVLASVWIVFGRTRWWLRLLALPPLIYGIGLAMRWLWISRWMLNYWINTPSSAQQWWQANLNDGIFTGGGSWAVSVVIGMAIICTWLLLTRAAGWFNPFHTVDATTTTSQLSPRWRTAARITALGLFALVAIFPLWLLFRLLTPLPIPDLAGPPPNGYSELIAAARAMGEADERAVQGLRNLSVAQLQEIASKNASSLEKVRTALRGGVKFPLIPPDGRPFARADNDRNAIFGLLRGIIVENLLALKSDTAAEKVAVNLDYIRLAIAESRSNGADQYERNAIFSPCEYGATNMLSNTRNSLDAEQCIQLAGELLELDAQRASWATRRANQRIIDENSGWEAHLQSILNDLARVDYFEDERNRHLRNQTRLRLLICSLAIRAFELENGRLPTELKELVPKYLRLVPSDPFKESEPLHYQQFQKEYLLWSVGRNQIDDSNGVLIGPLPRGTDDLSETGEFYVPTPVAPNSGNAP